ncbi:MAG: YbjN domain-containing protein [Clostridia bacterium]|jgi:hypothetical protein|nr:YbjN domain-containing protein [Clostridia bacterium]
MTDGERATAAYNAIVRFMTEAKLHYESNEDTREIFVTITGADFPVSLLFTVNEQLQRVETYCELPFAVRKEKAVDMAVALAAVNARIAYGKFCLYFDKGLCTFENTEYITDLEGFSAAYGRAIVAPAYAIADEYNDKLYALNKGLLPLKEFAANV